MYRIYFASILFTINSFTPFAQLEFPIEFNNSIVFNNGKIVSGEILNVSQFELKYKDEKQNVISVAAEKIFSYQKPGETITLLYQKDPEIGNDLTQGEMKKFIMGSYDARKNYSDLPLMITGAALSYSAVFIDTYLFKSEAQTMNENPDFPGSDFTPGAFKSEPSVFPVFVPLVFSLSTAIPKTRLRSKHVSFTKYKDDTYYQMGFEKMARQKRIMHSLSGSVGGLILGYLSYFLVDSLR